MGYLYVLSGVLTGLDFDPSANRMITIDLNGEVVVSNMYTDEQVAHFVTGQKQSMNTNDARKVALDI